jgi:hypothetical protein
LEQLRAAAAAHFEEPRIGQLTAQTAARQAEYGRVVVEAFRAGRFGAATVVVRSLLEITAWIAWPMCAKEDDQQRARLIRLLLAEYRTARNRGTTLPPDADELLRKTTGRAARKPPDFQQMLKDLDALERETEGGVEFWVSHAANYAWGNEHVHPSLYGPLARGGRLTPDPAIGRNALVTGHQYLAVTGATCALIADLPELKQKIEAHYAKAVGAQRRLFRPWQLRAASGNA